MTEKLFPVSILSSYVVAGTAVLLPKRMAVATADMKAAISGLRDALRQAGGELVLSDLFRSYDMQLQSHMDWKTGKKTAFSPPPGGSFHEAGRAFDLDLGRIKITLKDLWPMAAKFGLVPIIDKPNPGTSEAWHFECRGSHQRVYEYYKAGKGNNFDKPYKAAAASAINAVGVKVDQFGARQAEARLQSGLIRLGDVIGNLDGLIGPRTRQALSARGLDPQNFAASAAGVEHELQTAFPEEYFDKAPHDGAFGED